MNKHAWFLLLFCFSIKAFSQNSTEVDTTRIISFSDKMMFKVFMDTQLDSYSFRNDEMTDFKLSTNNQYRLSFSFDYEFIGGSLGFAPDFIPGNNEDDLKGESSITDFSFRFFLGNWVQQVGYAKTRGYYVENTVDFLPNWVAGRDRYLQFPDIKTTFWGGSTAYILNPNFSLRNVLYNTEWQLISAGSFIPTLRYGLTRLSSRFDEVKSYQNNYDVVLSSDYYYTWVIHKNWFVTPFISPGVGVRFTVDGEENLSEKDRNTSYPLSLDGGLQLGYSSRRIIFGANINFNSTWYNEDAQSHITNDKLYAKLYFGFRLDPPKAVSKLINKIM